MSNFKVLNHENNHENKYIELSSRGYHLCFTKTALKCNVLYLSLYLSIELDSKLTPSNSQMTLYLCQGMAVFFYKLLMYKLHWQAATLYVWKFLSVLKKAI